MKVPLDLPKGHLDPLEGPWIRCRGDSVDVFGVIYCGARDHMRPVPRGFERVQNYAQHPFLDPTY